MKILLSYLFILFFMTSMSYAGFEFSSKSTGTVALTASAVVYVDTDDVEERILHKPLERISPVTKIGIVEGTAFHGNKISTVTLQYSKNSSTGSMIDAPSVPVQEYSFSFTIPPSFITDGDDIKYRIIVYSVSNTTVSYPADGSWVDVSVDRKRSKNIGLGGGTVLMPNGNPFDGETSIEIPDKALRHTTAITIEELDPEDPSLPDASSPALTKRPHAVHRFSPFGQKFRTPSRINLLYIDIDNDGKVDVDGKKYPVEDLSVFWLDRLGIWRIIGGSIDEEKNLISFDVSHFSVFAVFPAKKLSSDDYRPRERIVAPYGDNRYIHFDGLDGTNTKIRIFDIRGREIRTIDSVPYEWDARDDSGSIVESGVYIYQFRAGGELISGTIAVAK